MRYLQAFTVFLFAAVLIAGCSARAPKRSFHAPLSEAGPVRADELGAAEQAIAANRPERARELLARVPVNGLDFQGRLRYDTVLAELAIMENRPAEALQLLPRSWQVSETSLALRIDRIRAQAYFRLNDPLSAVRALIERERRLSDPQHIAENRDLIWEGLRAAGPDGLDRQYGQVDPVIQGWIELARISRSLWSNEAELQQGLAEWRQRFPDHPAGERFGSSPFSLFALPDERFGEARSGELRQIALLLPLTGPYAATAEAVRDGFLAAALEVPAPRPSIRVYDVGAIDQTMLDAYQRAVADDADFIVGPLRKEAVATLAQLGRPRVPVLALNYLESGVNAPERFFQVGLAPEDEARRAAESALAQGLRRAVALVPDTDWGTRVLQAFTARLEELDGRLLESRSYPATTQDYSEPIRAMLGLDASAARRRALESVLGTQLQSEPRRRNDVDFIFVAARAEQARQIMPQLRFHRATGLPVYATSAVYDGDAPSAELNNLRFCDMPWMLGHEENLRATRERMRQLFPTRGREYERLVALGWDSRWLVNLIHSRQLIPGTYVEGAVGMLSMQPDGVLRRGLSCAEIARGKLTPLTVEPPAPVTGF